MLQFGTCAVSGVVSEAFVIALDCLRDSISGFSSRFTPEAFSSIGYCRKTAEVCDQGFLPLDELPSQADEYHLPEVAFSCCSVSSPIELIMLIREGAWASHWCLLKFELFEED